jgi:cystathionine beta-synthase
MGDPLPVVPPSLHLEHLSGYLESEAGAVLVEHDATEGDYAVITKSDLIGALAQANGTS